MPVGLWPYNIDVTPNGKIGISADNGNSGAPDGHVDTVSVIDLEQQPPRVVDRVVVGDAPEGFAISPKGTWPSRCCWVEPAFPRPCGSTPSATAASPC
jgi:DNA-binding beta-propeller fold protein YncE